MALEINDENFEEIVLKSNQPVLVDFWAINNAKLCEISFFGSGRFFVLAINLSKSFSII